jgi:hypothetical protein
MKYEMEHKHVITLLKHNSFVWVFTMMGVLPFLFMFTPWAIKAQNFIIAILPGVVSVTLLYIYRKKIASFFKYSIAIQLYPMYFLVGDNPVKNYWQDIISHKITTANNDCRIVLKMKDGRALKFTIIEQYASKEEMEVWQNFKEEFSREIYVKSSSKNYYKSKKAWLISKIIAVSYLLILLLAIINKDFFFSNIHLFLMYFGGTFPYLAYLIREKKRGQ